MQVRKIGVDTGNYLSLSVSLFLFVSISLSLAFALSLSRSLLLAPAASLTSHALGNIEKGLGGLFYQVH